MKATLNAPNLEKAGPPRVAEASYPYRAVKDSKWLAKSIRLAERNSSEENIEVYLRESHENGLLKRCLVGHLIAGKKEKPTLSVVR